MSTHEPFEISSTLKSFSYIATATAFEEIANENCISEEDD